MNQAQLFIWKEKYIKIVKTRYFIKIIGSSRTAQWQYESSVKIRIISENVPLIKKKSRSKEKQSGHTITQNSKFLWENESY